MVICVFFPLEMSHWGVSFYAWSGTVVPVIIAVVFDYTNDKHSGTEEANYVKLLQLNLCALSNERSEN